MEARSRYRSEHRRAEYGRLRKKTQEHEFVERLEQEFEFSPRMSRGLLDVAGKVPTAFELMINTEWSSIGSKAMREMY